MAKEVYQPLDIPFDPSEVTDEEMHEARSEAAEIIRERAWLGGPPPSFLPGWNMGRELQIWNRLAKYHGPVQVNGGIFHAREAIHVPLGQPFTLLLLGGKGRSHLMRRCIQRWQRLYNATGGASRASRVLRDMIGGKV